MTASANRSEADETTTHPETPFHEKNQAELVLAQGGLFQQARSLNGTVAEMTTFRDC
jgi:TolA-binding protein